MKKFLLILILFPALNIYSQELSATVIVNYEQLANQYQDRLINFDQQIQDYLNNTQFSGDNWEWQKIKCSFNIFFTGASGETNYNAQMVVTSQRPIEGQQRSSLMFSVMDNTWKFEYERNQSMYFDETIYDPLTSFLDYYAFVIIGLDSDSYEVQAGTPFYEKALNIAVNGGASAYADAWQSKSAAYSKRNLIDDLLSANYSKFREDYTDYHYNGLDLYYQNKQKTYDSLIKMVFGIRDLKEKINKRSVLLNVFFDAKHGELIDYLKEQEDKSIFNVLQKIDVGHTSKYLEAMEE
jgi:hypothetical protein